MDSKQYLIRAIQCLPNKHATETVRMHLKRALNELEITEKKAIKREQRPAHPIYSLNPKKSLEEIDKLINLENNKLKNAKPAPAIETLLD